MIQLTLSSWAQGLCSTPLSKPSLRSPLDKDPEQNIPTMVYSPNSTPGRHFGKDGQALLDNGCVAVLAEALSLVRGSQFVWVGRNSELARLREQGMIRIVGSYHGDVLWEVV